MPRSHTDQPLLFSGTLSTTADDWKSYLEVDLDQDVPLELLRTLHGKTARSILLVGDASICPEDDVATPAGHLPHGKQEA
jgi:hypothetical protein